MPVTLKEIVEASGYSLPTVSRILSGKGNHRAKSVEAVMRTARELGYRANQGARAMKTGKFEALALLQLHDPGINPLPRLTLDGIRNELAEQNKSLILTRIPRQMNDYARLPRSIREAMADGFLIGSYPEFATDLIEIVQETGLPHVWVNTKYDHDAVRPDDEAAGYEATQRLITLGHKDIAYADLHRNTRIPHYSCADRYAGYERAMKEHHLLPRLLSYEKKQSRPNSRAKIAHGWLKEHISTAYITYSDKEAMALMWVLLNEYGKRVPDDVSIVTYSDELSPAPIHFSAMRNPALEMGHIAVKQLLRKIEHSETSLPTQLLPFTWQDGITLAPPPA